MTIKFGDYEFDDDLTVAELAEKLGEAQGFKIVGNAYKRIPKLETYAPEGSNELTAQEVLDSC